MRLWRADVEDGVWIGDERVVVCMYLFRPGLLIRCAVFFVCEH